MIQVKESKNYYINARALSFSENDLGNTNRVAVSITTGTVIMAYYKGTIDYAADGNFERWTLKGYSTKLAQNTPYYIYARLSRTEPTAMVLFSPNLYELDGSIEDSETPTPSTEYWYVRIGQLTETDGTSPRELTYDSGLLSTDKGVNESNSALEEMFELNKQSTPWYIQVKHWFLSLTIKNALTLMGNLIFGGKTLTGVATSEETANAEKLNDETLPTTGYVEEYVKENTEDRFLRKDQDDETEYSLTSKGMTVREGFSFGNTLSSLDFLKGQNGIGAYIDASGNWHIETDYLDVRLKFTATEVEIQHASHIGGKIINTHANMVVTNVVETSTGYICYMNTRDDEGNVIYNMWKVGDQAFCETFNLTQQADGKMGNHFLWRLVTEVGENYITLSKTDCAEASDAPKTGDELIALGHRTDTERQGAIIQASAGSGSPYIRIYKGINSYTLPKPKINLAPDGTEISADSIKLESTGGNVEDEIGSLISVTNKLSREIDGSFYVWQADDNTIPTLENEPAINWEDDETKLEHVDDFYINTDGFCYQFAYDADTDTFFWKIVTDRYLIKFVEQIGEKRRVYVEQPTTDDVYDIGDTWVNATYPEDGSTYNNDVLVCIQAKDKGEAFSIDHWRKNSKYTDDTVANLVKQELETFQSEYSETVATIQGQIDGKAETWYQDADPSENWETAEDKKEHAGDLWYKESTGETFYFDGTKWNEQNIPVAVFDRFDAKASIFVSEPSSYKENDMWILGEARTLAGDTTYPKGTIVFASQDSEVFNAEHWDKYDRYTDDTSLQQFIENAFNSTIDEIKGQIDGKAETWYQDADPSENWETAEDKKEHAGDLWYKESTGETFYFDGTKWNEQNIPVAVFDRFDAKASIFVSEPSSYKENDMWILGEARTLAGNTTYPKGTIVFASQDSEVFNAEHWDKYDRYTDDTSLQQFIENTFNNAIDEIKGQIDGKAETWYQDADPSENWETAEDKKEHIGDMWCTTDGTTMIWNGSEWVQQGIPQEVFDDIDGKSSIYVEKPDTGYQARDMWILEKEYTLDRVEPYNAGTIVIATADYDENLGFQPTHWTKLDSYTDKEEMEEVKDDLQGLINKVNSEFGGSFYIWQGETEDVPTLENEPAVNWTDDAMLQAHVDDFYISSDGIVYQFQNADGVFSWAKVDDKYIVAYIEQMRSQLLKTGIDIEGNTITVTANQFKVQDRLGNPMAIFEVDATTGLPTIKGEYLNVNYVNIADKAIINREGEAWFTNAHITGEVNAGSGEIGGFTIEDNAITTAGDSFISFELDDLKYLRINELDNILLDASTYGDNTVAASFYAQGDGSTALKVQAQADAIALTSLGDNRLISRYDTESSIIAGLALSVGSGSTFTNPTNIGLSTAWTDFLVADGDITLPSAKNCKGKVLFVKANGNISCPVDSGGGIVLAAGTSPQESRDGNNHSLIYISDGNSWYEFYCG